MSTIQARSRVETQRPSRNWIAETLIVAGILAFGYFAVMLEDSSMLWHVANGQAGSLTAQSAP